MMRPIAPLIISLLLLSCSDAPPWVGSVETREGVEVISNPAEPLSGELRDFLTELWEVQDPGWEAPTIVHAGAGLVSVVDPQANRIHQVTTSGELRASLGRTGGGPGEFLRLLDAFRQGDRLVVLDAGKSAVEYLDPEGGYLTSLHIDGQAWGGFPLADGTLLLEGEFLSDPTEESRGDWVIVGEGHDPRAFTSVPLRPLPEEEGVQCSDLFPWAGGAARLRFTTPWIQVFDLAGNIVMESRIDLPVEVVTDSERESALADLRRTMAERGLPPEYMQQSLVVMEERWRVKCRFGPLAKDPSGGLAAFLEQNPDDFGSGNATIHLLSPEGVYLARAELPHPWRAFTLEDGVIYALTRDPSTDLITLRAYSVDLPGHLFTEAAEALAEARRRGGEGR